MSLRSARALAAAAATAGFLAFGTPQAHASSIVFIKGSNVWLTTPEGKQRRVTKDGTSRSPYYSPSQTSGGTIVALKGPDGRPVATTFNGGGSRIHRLSQSGRHLSKSRITLFEPLQNVVPRAFAAEVSPNGKRIAINQALYEVENSGGGRQLRLAAVNLVYKDPKSGSYKGKSELIGQTLWGPSWLDSTRLLVFDQFSQVGPQIYSARVNTEPVAFHRDPARSQNVPDWNGVELGAGDMTRTGDKLAAARAEVGGANRTIVIYSTSGLSRQPTELCTIAGRNLESDPSLTWAPDGNRLAWFENDNGKFSIWTTPVNLSAANCGLAPKRLLSGGVAPDWGRANVKRR